MMPATKCFALLSGMVGRPRSRRGSPTGPAAADLLDQIAERWNCWRRHSEPTRQHQHRLQLHLHILAIAIEDDLALLDKLVPPEDSDAR